MPFPEIDPIAFSIGPFAVRWYALAYLGGVLLGAAYGHTLLARKTLWKDGQPPFEAGSIWDFAFWAVVGIVIGGRLGMCCSTTCPTTQRTRARSSRCGTAA